jgi:exodeoxyribonuclease VII large subunit
VELYGTRGQLQLRVRGMKPDGPGALRLKLEELRLKLEAEGLFAPDRKRRLPILPVRVGIVTSREGAVLRDIVTTLQRRNPAVHLVMCHAPVQGPEAPGRLVYALERVVAYGVDCVIVARGGGSLEDLMAFNDEELVRAVAACPVPIVSAIGHQTDTTLCDLAADRRAPTPTAAAEMVAAERSELLRSLDVSRTRLERAMSRQLASHRERLERLQGSPCLRYPERLFSSARLQLSGLVAALARSQAGRLRLERSSLERLREALLARHPRATLERHRSLLDELRLRLEHFLRLRTQRERGYLGPLAARLLPALTRGLERRRQALGALAGQLDALSPLKVLERGYAYTLDSQGRLVRSVAGVSVGDRLQVHLCDGVLGVCADSVGPGVGPSA